MKVFAVCGAKGSGKDLVSNLIGKILLDTKKTVKQLAFADPIKEVIMNAFNLRYTSEYDMFKRSTVTLWDGREVYGREILRSIGMRMRSYDSEQFIEGVKDAIDRFETYHPEEFDNTVFVITDLRFKNEVKWIKSEKIPIIKVKRDSQVYDGHVSEREIDDFLCDYILDNNGTIEELEEQVKDVLTKEGVL